MGILTRELCLIVLFCGYSALTTAAEPRSEIRFTPLEWKTATGEAVAADTATLTVPENRRDKKTRQISIAVVRFRGKGGGIPLVYVSGGSGSGIAAAQGPRMPFFLALRDIGDVVVFDIRGGGRSSPHLACNAALDLDMSQPLTRAALVTATRRANRTCADSLRAAGFDLRGYNGREVTADIDDVRKALGAKQIRLLGTSTGTHLALEYVRRHPRQVASVFLAGTEGPGNTAHLPSDLDETVIRVASRLPNVPLLDLMRSVFAALDSNPVSVDVKGSTVKMGGYDARVFVASTLGDRKQMNMLPQLLSAMKAGQFAPLAALKIQALRNPFQAPWESLHDCQAGSSGARQRRVVAEAATALLDYATLDFAEACDGWGVGELDESYRTPVRTTVPALFISGSLDGRTPPTNAEQVRRGFATSAHLIVEGASHGDDLFISTPEILRNIKAFTLAPRGSTHTVQIQ